MFLEIFHEEKKKNTKSLRKLLLTLVCLCLWFPTASSAPELQKSTQKQIDNYLSKGIHFERFVIQSYIFFFICCFLSAAAIQWLISHVTVYVIPVSIIWFLFGMLLHYMLQWLPLRQNDSFIATKLFTHGIENIGSVNAEVVYLLFLPILLYDSCLNINWHKFKRFATSGICLAVLGVFYQTAVVGFLMHISFENSSSSSWKNSFLYSSAMVSTDPVAVVSVLNGMQAPDKLASMFEGESLINDGSSMLFFQFFQSLSKGNEQNFKTVFLQFLNLLILGPLWGFFCGFIVYIWVRYFRQFPDMQVLILISGSYAVYFIGDRFMHTSGPLAIVCYGLFFVSFGHIALDHKTYERHHYSVQALGLFANSSVFVISGVVAARMISESLNLTNAEFDSKTLLNVLILYLYLMFARATMVLIFLPVLKRTGYGVNWKETVLLIWGGLRGAIVLAMALMIEQDYQILSTARYTAILYLAGSTFLILLLNGTSFELLFKLLNPYPPKPFRCVYLERVMKLIDFHYNQEKKILENHWLFKNSGVLEYADRIVPILGWRKMNHRGKIDLKLPNIHAAFFNIPEISSLQLDSEEYSSKYHSNFVGTPDSSRRPSAAQSNISPKPTYKPEQRAHIAAANVCGLRDINEVEGTFDPYMYLQLIDTGTNFEQSENDSKYSKFNPKLGNDPSSVLSQFSDKQLSKFSYDYVPKSFNIQFVPKQKIKKPLEPLNSLQSNASCLADDLPNPQSNFHSEIQKKFNINFTDLPSEPTKLISRITSEPFGSSRFDTTRMTRLRLPEWIGRQDSDAFSLQYPQYMFTPDEYAQHEPRIHHKFETDLNKSVKKRDLFCWRPFKSSSKKLISKKLMPKMFVNNMPSKPVRKSSSIFPGRIMSAPTGFLDTRKLGFDDDGSDLSEEYLPALEKLRKSKKKSKQRGFMKVLRKDREGELYIMAMNAIRQMYHRLYQQNFIGGAAYLTLNYVLDVSIDFAIALTTRQVWKDVLANNKTIGSVIDPSVKVDVTESMTGFEFEWKLLATRLRCYKHNERSWLTKRIHNKNWFKFLIAYPSAVVDLQLVSAYVDVHEELIYKGGTSLVDFLGPRLLQSYNDQILAAKRFINFLREFYSISYSYALVVHASAILLNWKELLVEEQAQKGLILQEDCEYILEMFKEQHQNLASFTPFKLSWPSFNCRRPERIL